MCTHAVLTIFASFYTASRVYFCISALPVLVSYFMCLLLRFVWVCVIHSNFGFVHDPLVIFDIANNVLLLFYIS